MLYCDRIEGIQLTYNHINAGIFLFLFKQVLGRFTFMIDFYVVQSTEVKVREEGLQERPAQAHSIR